MNPDMITRMLLFPLIGSALLGLSRLTGRWIPNRFAGWIASAAVFLSFTQAWSLATEYMTAPDTAALRVSWGSWIDLAPIQLLFGFQVDALSAVLVLIVTGVGLLIHIYSIGYMAKDPDQVRYFAYLNLFCALMLILLTASSLPLLFVGWEGVGLCSYLLISFWFGDRTKAKAGKKAFLVNRIGDAGFLLGMFLIYSLFQTFEFSALAESTRLAELKQSGQLELIAFLLFLGCVGKSAQFPLYLWLPDAMAGPTPVSALIHAATMVTAGVYLIARMAFLFSLAPITSELIAWTGAITAFFAATVALFQYDIKKVLAFSTVSQLGFMVLSMGVGSYDAGMFHLVTHAFFKALLFLAAGSVIHALHGEQDIRRMGGLKSYLVLTTIVFSTGYLAIIGFPLFSGWFSKDAILLGISSAAIEGRAPLFGLAFAAALLTVVYMTRLFCLVFLGIPEIPRSQLRDLHESPRIMLLPMCVLAFFSFLGGTALFRFQETLSHIFQHLIPVSVREDLISESTLMWVVSTSVLVLLALTVRAFTTWHSSLQTWKTRVGTLSSLIEQEYRFDEWATLLSSRFTQAMATVTRICDQYLIDGVLNRVTTLTRSAALGVMRLQSGFVQVYALTLLVAMLMVFWLLGLEQ